MVYDHVKFPRVLFFFYLFHSMDNFSVHDSMSQASGRKSYPSIRVSVCTLPWASAFVMSPLPHPLHLVIIVINPINAVIIFILQFRKLTEGQARFRLELNFT